MSVSSIAYPISVLGPGQRVVLWTQGCTIACPGCASRDTWNEADGKFMPVTELVELLASHLVSPECCGLSVSGGEPLDQPGPLSRLLRQVRDRMRPDQDILLFTGRTFEYLRARHHDLLRGLDAVVAGPYRESSPSDLVWRSSSNQELVLVSDLARRKYDAFIETRDWDRLQVIESDGRLTIVGLPGPGDLDRLTTRLSEHGVRLDQRSWVGSESYEGASGE